jgi:hypothetical protein
MSGLKRLYDSVSEMEHQRLMKGTILHTSRYIVLLTHKTFATKYFVLILLQFS